MTRLKFFVTETLYEFLKAIEGPRWPMTRLTLGVIERPHRPMKRLTEVLAKDRFFKFPTVTSHVAP